MSYFDVESSLKEASKRLDLVSKRRERLIKESRDVISLSAKTIICVHTSNFAEARKLSKEAKKRLEELRKVAGSDLLRYIFTPEQEFVECSVMLAISSKKEIPSIKSLGVSPGSYVLGLLDAIGELKRSVYDSIRQNEIQGAEMKFVTMESLYTLISPFAVYDNIVQGVKRKLDVARMLIEDTRATITEEARRTDFMTTISELSKKLGTAPFAEAKRKREAPEESETQITDSEED
ncbi:MAG: RNA-binding protein [Nitrososphaerales archaeon]